MLVSFLPSRTQRSLTKDDGSSRNRVGQPRRQGESIFSFSLALPRPEILIGLRIQAYYRRAIANLAILKPKAAIVDLKHVSCD